jgi:hypothetical protein
MELPTVVANFMTPLKTLTTHATAVAQKGVTTSSSKKIERAPKKNPKIRLW